jgi:DNA-directed RNA polymerase specialized sigma24 family protein
MSTPTTPLPEPVSPPPGRPRSLESWMNQLADILPRLRRSSGQPLAPDAVLDAVARAWEMGGQDGTCFHSLDHLVNWVRQTAHWRSVDSFRQARRRRVQSLSAGKSAEVPDPRQSQAARRRWSREDQGTVWGCLQKLPADERAALEGHFYEGLTDIEIGRRLFGPQGGDRAVGLRAWRLRQRAQARLGQLLRHEGVGA